MTQEKNQAIAAFRFGVIHEFIGGANQDPLEKVRLIREKSLRKWIIPYSSRTWISENTIYRWIRRYKEGGGKIESFYPQPRNDNGKSRKLCKHLSHTFNPCELGTLCSDGTGIFFPLQKGVRQGSRTG
jgi:putative transposase